MKKILLIFGLLVLVSITAYAKDKNPPVGTLGINLDQKIVHSRHVNLNIAAEDETSGVASMCISNSMTSCNRWEKFNEHKAWTLTKGNGRKKVCLWTMDFAGNVTPPTCTMITLKEGH